jgi:hypothetical protein
MTDFHQADRPRSAETARAQAIRARWQAVLDRYDPDSELHHTAREMLWLLDQLRAAQEEIATLSRRTVIAETHNIELSDSLLRSESALQARASAGALMKDTIKAAYAEGFADAREDTASVSTDAEDIEPFWRQSLSAKIQAPPVATTETPVEIALRLRSMLDRCAALAAGSGPCDRCQAEIAHAFEPVATTGPDEPSTRVAVHCRACSSVVYLREGDSLNPLTAWSFNTNDGWRCPTCPTPPPDAPTRG